MAPRDETENQNKNKKKDQTHDDEQCTLHAAASASGQLCGAKKAQSAASRDRDRGADVGGGRSGRRHGASAQRALDRVAALSARDKGGGRATYRHGGHSSCDAGVGGKGA